MKQFPENVQSYKKTPLLNQNTIPAGLLKAHTTKVGTWGKINVLNGKLLYVIETDPQELIELSTNNYGVVEPEIPHHVELLGEVEFFVEFFK